MSLTLQCGVCTKPIRESSDKVFCFGPCGLIKHLKCSSEIDKEGLQAMTTNRGLKYFCHECRQQQIGYNTVSQKCDEILRALNESFTKWSEIDKRMKKLEDSMSAKMRSEFEKVTEKITQISDEKGSVNLKLNELSATIKNNNQSSNVERGRNTTTSSFANVLKDAVNIPPPTPRKIKKKEPVVIVKPKNTEQSAARTKKDLRNKMSKNAKQIQTVREGNKGTVFLEVKNNESAETVAAAVKENCGEEYEVFIPKTLRPRLKIVGAADELDIESLEECFLEQNDWLREIYMEKSGCLKKMGMKLIACYSSNRGDAENFNFIVEVDDSAHEAMLRKGKINVGWEKCRVFECYGIIRCFKCCAYGHKSTDCQNEETCSKCAGKHMTSKCTSSMTCCANCKKVNETRNLNLDTAHYAYNPECTVYKRLVKRKQQQIGLDIPDK